MHQTSTKYPFRLVALLSLWLPFVMNAPALADEGDALNFELSQRLLRDSNLYRLPDGAAAPRGDRHDTVSITGAGAAFDHRYSRQRLRADAQVTHAAYAIHDDLDHTAPKGRLAWQWEFGNRWSGELGRSYAESLAGFDDVIGTRQVIRRLTRTAASADYWWHPNWSSGVGAAWVRNRYNNDALPGSEYDARDYDVSLTYRPASGNRLALTLRDTEGRYPNRAAVAGSIRDYRQREIRLSGERRLSGALLLSGYVGHTRRTYDLASHRDFEGPTGRVALRWVPTGKTTVDLAWRREIGAEQDLVSNYAVTDSLSVAPSWAVTDKVRIGASYELATRDFDGDPELGFGGIVPDRSDRTHRQSLTLAYQPMRALSLVAGVERLRRTSALAVREYQADTAWLSAVFAF